MGCANTSAEAVIIFSFSSQLFDYKRNKKIHAKEENKEGRNGEHE